MTTFEEYLENKLKDPIFRAEYETHQPEYDIMYAIVESELTQKQLSDRTGIAQCDISKLENGDANPTLKTLKRLAAGMNMKIKIEFVPCSNEDANLILNSLNDLAQQPIPRAI